MRGGEADPAPAQKQKSTTQSQEAVSACKKFQHPLRDAFLFHHFKNHLKMANIFNSVKMTRPGKNIFDLKHDHKLSCNFGQLVPILLEEAVPGDKFKIKCEAMVRLAPMVAPPMHRSDVYIHYFFVPNRLIWPNWEKFITMQPTGIEPPNFPTIKMGDTGSTGVYGPLCDHLGIPTPIGTWEEDVNAMPFAAYQFVYNEFYRDQNLIDPVVYQLTDGDNTGNSDLWQLRKRAWSHDYFTSALPWAQKGAAVEIPIGQLQDVPVKLNNPDDTTLEGTPADIPVDGVITGGIPVGTMYAQTSNAVTEATSINDLRRAFRLQEWLEKAARAGSRYKEQILSFFGVQSSDKRLQRPEYITGVKTPIQISEVLNTTGTENAPQGDMAGHGIAYMNGYGEQYFCEEHGFVIGIMSVLPQPAYQQGLRKLWLKTEDAFQYFWPQFEHIGEQEIQNKELYAFSPTGQETFGYIPRYAEYKYSPSRVSGDFRTTLNHWHMGRIFASQPALNQTFIEMNSASVDRIFAVTDENEQKLWCHIFNDIKVVRPMAKYGTPTF